MKKAAFGLLFCCLFVFSADAQTPNRDEDFESWNDVQMTVPMTKKFDFYTAFTARFAKNVSRLNDIRLAVGFIFKPTKALSFQPFYWRIDARNASGRFRPENRLNLRAAYRFPFKHFGLIHRSLFEYRLRRPRNSFRYRPSLTFEKAIPEKFIPKATFYLTEEVFYDSILKRFSRNRITAGINKVLSKKTSLDLYFMRQNDGTVHPGDWSVVGTALKIRL